MSATVAAVIPTYNRRKFAERAVASVLEQTVPVNEVIVVDDGSTDGTADHLCGVFGDRIRVITQENGGLSRSRLAGAKAAESDWLAFLDDDDVFPKDRNALLLAAAEANPDAVLAFGNMAIMQEGEIVRDLFTDCAFEVEGRWRRIDDAMSAVYPELFGRMITGLVNRRVLFESDALGEGLRAGEDFVGSVRLAMAGPFVAIPEVTYVVDRSEELGASSLALATMREGPIQMEFARSRRIAFSELCRRQGKRRWAKQYRGAVRQSIAVDETIRGVRALREALEQFKYGVDVVALAFVAACVLGRPGIRLWRTVRGR